MLPNDYRSPAPMTNVRVSEIITPKRQLRVDIRLGTLPMSTTDAVVLVVRPDLEATNDELLVRAGDATMSA